MRYLRLYANFIRFSFGKAMEFRIDFYFRIVMDIVYYTVSIYFFKVIFLHSNMIGDWTEPQVMIFVSGFLLVDAINMTMFSNNVWHLPIFINRGDLDYYLVRPVSSLFFLSLRDFAFNSFVNLVFAIGICVWAFSLYPNPLEIHRIILFVFLIFTGTILFHFINITSILPVFWTHSGTGLRNIYWSIYKFAERPDSIYRGTLRKVFVTIFPLCVISSLPTRVLFQDNYLQVATYCLFVTLLFGIGISLLWKFCLRHYASASS